MKDSVLQSKLDRFVELLATYNEQHWHAYFQIAQLLLREDRVAQAKRKIRKAYGGMGSINDALYFTGAPKEIAEEGFTICHDLYVLAEPEHFLAKILKIFRNENGA